jgi:hypothetical protein
MIHLKPRAAHAPAAASKLPHGQLSDWRMPYRTICRREPEALDGAVVGFGERMRRARRTRCTVALAAIALACGVPCVLLATPRHALALAPAPPPVHGRLPVDAVLCGPWDCPMQPEDPESDGAKNQAFARDVCAIDCNRTWW